MDRQESEHNAAGYFVTSVTDSQAESDISYSRSVDDLSDREKQIVELINEDPGYAATGWQCVIPTLK